MLNPASLLSKKTSRRVSCRIAAVLFCVASSLAPYGLPMQAQQRSQTAQSGAAGSSIARSSSSEQVQRVVLLLRGSDVQQKALATLLDQQQTPGSSAFHQWLTPAEFAAQFAPTTAQTAAVTHWLTAQGLTVEPLPTSRLWIVFSGTRAQVETAFQARLTTAGADADGVPILRFAAQPVIPPAIAQQVVGVVSLDGVRVTAALTPAVNTDAATLAVASTSNPSLPLTPMLLAQTGALIAPEKTAAAAQTGAQLSVAADANTSGGTNTGTGATIAIPTRSNLRQEDVAAFRSAFNLGSGTGQFAVLPDGNDPGRTTDESAAAAMTDWAMAAAPGAQVNVIPSESTNATDGLDLAFAAAVNHAAGHTILLGYESCETAMSAAHAAFYAALDKLAAAEGVAVVAASGDHGVEECGATNSAPSTGMQNGPAVNALASTPWNLAVGAATLTSSSAGGNSAGIAGWEPASATAQAQATGGGVSALYATPTWQSAQGMPTSDPSTGSASGSSSGSASSSGAAHHRYLPDVVLPAASSGAAFCMSGANLAASCNAMQSSGSAIAAAMMAGLAARLDAQYGAQGNLAPNLYRLARMAPSNASGTTTNAASSLATAAVAPATPVNTSATSAPAIVDVTTGGNRLFCASGACSASTAADSTAGRVGFAAAVGYDLATGLGTVNAAALMAQWTRPDATGTDQAQVLMTNQNGLTYNPSTDIDLTAKVTSLSGGAVPTGTVQFYDQTSQQNAGTPVTLAADGTASYVEPAQFTIGGHNIEAIYSGDSTYAGGTSLPVTFNIQPSSTTLVVAPSTTTPAAGASVTVTGTVTSSNPGNSPPTGILTVNLDGVPQGTAKFATTSNVTTASYNLTSPTSGSHTLQGIYSGDTNYNQSTSPSVTISIAKIATTVSISATPSKLAQGTPESFTATIAPAAATTTTYTITGTVSFYDGGTTLLGTAPVSSNGATLSDIAISAAVAHTITAVYSGDATWASSTSSPLVLEPILQPVTVTLTSTSAVLSPGQAANLTATVTPVTAPAAAIEQNPTGNVFFYAGTQLIGESALSVGIADTAVATLNVPTLPGGTYQLTAIYSGDAIFGQATSNALGFSVESFTIASTTTSITITQGQSATVPYTITATGGLTGPIQILCGEQNPPTVGAITCTFNPSIVSGTEAATLTITTYPGTIQAANHAPHRPGGAARTGALLALAGVLLLPLGRRRARWLRHAHLLIALWFVGIAFTSLGCSSTTPSSNGTNTSGTPLGTATLQITGAAYVNNVTVSNHSYLSVNVVP